MTHLQVLNMLASKPTKPNQCYSNISVIFVTLLLLQVLQFETKLKHEFVDFPGSTVEERFLYPCLILCILINFTTVDIN